ncbi:hypothetical protein BDM02DRAFT_3105839 [Thelephora ganbajun]|uniref:Uncharacterized protein n=1 Tax=Thelephora ganbajun TaxID=370292 RepID=A0ACB6YYY6_THEGA|nr:hypothetical protein BDM02DRAFT_3105839 [Thelephora ganbajun]
MPKGNKQAEAANKKKLVEQKEAAIQCAVELYQILAHSNPEKLVGYRTVCKMVEDEMEREVGVRIELCYNTICARLNGVYSLSQFNQEKAWLLPEEECQGHRP